ncbi:MAG TPA: BON domain-containing protein [Chloroflexota bacterium]|jgi:hypothetical protein|nr:BON domain-containing protein [Chloroflexota bacterium]
MARDYERHWYPEFEADPGRERWAGREPGMAYRPYGRQEQTYGQRPNDWSGRGMPDDSGHWGVRHAPDLYPEFHDAPRGPDWEAPWDRHGRVEQRRQGPYAGRGPRNYTRSNDRIREEVSDRLSDHPWLDASQIEVMVEDGVVTLTGAVEDRTQKRMAEDVADSVSGVRDVNNQLRIDPATRPEEHRFTQHVTTP